MRRTHANAATIIHITLPRDAGALEPGEHEAVLIVEKAGNLPAFSTSGTAPAAAHPAEATAAAPAPVEPLASYLDRARLAHVRAALRAANGSRKAAAKALGVDVRTIFRILGATSVSRHRQIDQLRVGEARPDRADDARRNEEDR